MASQFPNLPGVRLALLDGGLVAIQDAPITESVLIIGPALDGPTDRPISVNTVGEITSVFGPTQFNVDYTGPNGEKTGFSGNMLIKALHEVQMGGCADIRLMRVGGVRAAGTFTNSAPTTGVTGTITLAALNPGRIYNSATVAFTSGTISGSAVISQPASKGGTVTINYSGAQSGTTVIQLLDMINSHPRNRTVRLDAGTINAGSGARFLQGTAMLSGGTDGTNKDDNATNKTAMYAALTDATTGTFVLLADYEADNVLLTGIYLDDQVNQSDTTKSVSQDFDNFLASRSVDYPMVGFIGVRPLDKILSRTSINDHFDALMNTTAGNRATNWLNAGYFMYHGFNFSDGSIIDQPVDAGAYLQVVVGDLVLNDPDLGLYVESAAGIYAGLVSSLKAHIPATYKRVPGVFNLPYEFSRAQLDALTGGVGQDETQNVFGQGAYVTIRRIPGQGILFVRDVTAANRKSDFKDLQPLRIANAVHKGIKDIGFSFLGQPNDIAHRQALTTAIKTFLDGMFDSGALLGRENVGYQLDVRGGGTPFSNLLGILDVSLILRPALQIKAINVKIRMSL